MIDCVLSVDVTDKESESCGHQVQQQWRWRWHQCTDCFIQVNTHSKWIWRIVLLMKILLLCVFVFSVHFASVSAVVLL